MKKRKLLFVFLMLVMGGLFFSSCSKDDKIEEVEKAEVEKSLDGTIWRVIAFYTYDDGRKYSITTTVYFYEKQCSVITDSPFFGSKRTYIYDYTYNHPKASLIPVDNLSYLGAINATVNNNKMSLFDTYKEETIIVTKLTIV